MRKIVLILLCSVSFASCSFLETRNATEFNNAIVTEQNAIITQVIGLNNAITTLDSAGAQQKRVQLIASVDACLAKVDKLEYKGDDKGLKANFIKLLNFYKATFSNEYTQIIAISFDKNATATDATKIQNMTNNIVKEEEVLDNKFQAAQQEFAKAHNMQIEENEMQKKIDQMSK
ncbi:hypothetical protein DBR32_04610 [Taibaiella sp. KBW10]|uniref:LIC11966 family surface protein n=1 Tax=Taibaiella sp. KBW10 TaxID=2153357 RepID=UPI000F59F90E|nr:hypothetical protein [Taibaiella sp. KBW10]RQO31255.1 hypothetical protein DBR32_04610 [Taibaiella sp. KBW10]